MISKKTVLILSLFLLLIVFCGAVSAESITSSTVTNTNVYSESNQYDIAPSGYADTTATASGVSHTASMYLSGTSASISPSSGALGDTFTLALTNQKGASVFYDSTNGVYVGVVTDSTGTYYLSDFTDMRNNVAGTFTPSVVFKNPSQTLTAITTNSYTVGANPSISSISVTSSSPAQVGSTVQVSATLSNINEAGTVQFATSTNGNTWSNVGNAVSIASGATSATQTFTGSSTAGLYYVKAVLTVGSTTFDSHTSGVSDGQVRLVTAPTLGDISISPATIGKLNTAYTLTLSETVTDMGGGAYILFDLQTSTDGSTWSYVSGGSQYISAISSTVTITDTAETTHYYRYRVSTISGFPASTTAYSPNTVTFQTFAPPATPTAEINPATITINTATEVTLTASNVPTAPTGNTYYYQWYYGSTSTPSSGDTAITEQETTLTNPVTWSANFPSTGTKYVYLKITDLAGNNPVYSNRVSLSIVSMSASAVWATSYHGMSDNINLVISGHSLGNSYTWYYQEDVAGSTWNTIGTTGDNILTKTPTQMGLTSGKSYKFKAVYQGIDIIASNTLTPYADPTVSTPTASSSSVHVPGSSILTSHVSDTTLVSGYQWQKYSSSSWRDISGATSSTYTAQISTTGEHQFRVIVTGLSGHTQTSNAVTITGGAAPTVTITSPTNGQKFTTKGIQITLTATATGTGNTYLWEFSDTSGIEHGDLTTLNSWVKFKYSGDKQIRITATNEYGSSYSTVTINYFDPTTRPMATATLAPVPTTAVTHLTDVVNVQPGTYPSVKDTVKAIMSPIEESVPAGFVFVIVFGVIFLMLWLITKNTAVPSIIGIIFGAFLLALFPASYYGPAMIILAISIAGGMYRVFRPPQ